MAQTEVADEMELIPTFAVALSGCDLRCDFCITGRESWNASAGRPLEVEELAARAEGALRDGARTIMILGGEPTIHLPAALELAAAFPSGAPLVWKTNTHMAEQARELLDGIFDVWVADYKFGNDICAQRLAHVPDYVAVVQENLRWAMARTRVIIRHVLLPGHVDCCWRPMARWIAEALPGVAVSLRDGFWPAWRSGRHAELGTGRVESDRAHWIAREHELNLIA